LGLRIKAMFTQARQRTHPKRIIVPVHTMKANMSGGKAPLILDLRWKSAVNITPLVDLLQGKNSAPAEEEAGGPQRLSGHFREYTGTRAPDNLARSLIATLNTQSRLRILS